MPNAVRFFPFKIHGSFQIRLKFGFISDHQIFAPHQETLYFQFGAEFGKGFPILNAWGVFKFGLNLVPFGLLKFIFMVQDFIFLNLVPISVRFSHLKCMGSFQIRLEFGSISDHRRFAPHQETSYFQFGAEFGKIYPI